MPSPGENEASDLIKEAGWGCVGAPRILLRQVWGSEWEQEEARKENHMTELVSFIAWGCPRFLRSRVCVAEMCCVKMWPNSVRDLELKVTK